MRPRKRIAIFGASATAGGLLRFVLDTRSYAAKLVAEESLLVDPAMAWDAVLLVGLCTEECDRLECAIWHSRPGIAGVGRCQRVQARGELPESEWIADVLEKVRLATIRKRWPRPVLAGTSLAAAPVAAAAQVSA